MIFILKNIEAIAKLALLRYRLSSFNGLNGVSCASLLA
ncbi:Uncharacterised protein [Vibrio cholerae]|nr:Uncharacterised protein [Vibrio cholerae]CSI92850.1 Uncharacterised protein [Vibrio cholerae]